MGVGVGVMCECVGVCVFLWVDVCPSVGGWMDVCVCV